MSRKAAKDVPERRAAKGKYDKWVALYDDGMNEAYLKEKYITDRMENALANGEFDVYFQPQFHHVTDQLKLSGFGCNLFRQGCKNQS